MVTKGENTTVDFGDGQGPQPFGGMSGIRVVKGAGRKPDMKPWREMMADALSELNAEFCKTFDTPATCAALYDATVARLNDVALLFGVRVRREDVAFTRRDGFIEADLSAGVVEQLDEAQARMERTAKPSQGKATNADPNAMNAWLATLSPPKDKPMPYTHPTFANIDRNDRPAFTKALVSLIEEGSMTHVSGPGVFWGGPERWRLTPKAMTPQVEMVLRFGGERGDIKLERVMVDGVAVELTPELRSARLNTNIARWCDGWRHDGLLAQLRPIAEAPDAFLPAWFECVISDMPPWYEPRPDVADLIATLRAQYAEMERKRALAASMASLRDDFDNLPDAEPCGIVPRK